MKLRIIFVFICSIMEISSVMALEIATIENPQYSQVLKTAAKEVQFPLSPEDKNVIKLLKSKLQDLGGVGLAAPQVNYSKQIVAIYIPEDAQLLRDNANVYPMHILINPSYHALPDSAKISDFEGCYSVESKAGKVPRYNHIQVRYYDEAGKQHTHDESGFYARVIQHEIDHLHGILIIDRLTPDCMQGTISEMMAIRRAELSPEKRKLFDKLMAKKIKND